MGQAAKASLTARADREAATKLVWTMPVHAHYGGKKKSCCSTPSPPAHHSAHHSALLASCVSTPCSWACEKSMLKRAARYSVGSCTAEFMLLFSATATMSMHQINLLAVTCQCPPPLDLVRLSLPCS